LSTPGYSSAESRAFEVLLIAATPRIREREWKARSEIRSDVSTLAPAWQEATSDGLIPFVAGRMRDYPARMIAFHLIDRAARLCFAAPPR